jgi:hypothetical protein
MEKILKEKKQLLYKLKNIKPNTSDYDEVRTLSINIETIKKDIIGIKKVVRKSKIKNIYDNH